MLRPYSINIRNFISYKEFSYIFPQGIPKIIIGRNLDDPSQKGNGSGKSGINEAVVFALTGTYIRPVQVRELISNWADSSEIDLVLNNTLAGKDLRIYRKIYASPNKSQECRVWIKNKDEDYIDYHPDNTYNNEIQRSSVLEYNKYILEYIDKTKEDLLQFFLLFRDAGYKPFLSLGDTLKKGIVNRFSKADNVDLVDPLIKEDSLKLQKKIDQYKLEEAGILSKIEVYTEQIQQFKPEEEKKKIEDQILQLEEQFKSILDSQVLINEEIERLNSQLIEKTQSLEKYKSENNVDFSEQKQSAETEKKEIEVKINLLKDSLPKVQSKYSIEIQQIKDKEAKFIDEENRLREELKVFQSDKKDKEKELSTLQNKIAGAIECPKCNHEFSLQEEDFNVVEARVKCESIVEEINLYITGITEIEKEIQQQIDQRSALSVDKEEINKKILNDQETIKNDISVFFNETTAVESRLTDISKKEQEYKRDVQLIQSEINSIELKKKDKSSELVSSETRLEQIEKQVIDLSRKEIVDTTIELRDKIEILNSDLETLRLSIDEENTKKLDIDSWLVNFKGFKSELANKSIRSIQDYTNLFLQKMGSNISIEIEGYRQLSDKKLKEEISTIVYKDGVSEGSYGKFSAGERARIDICVILALQELININSKIPLDLLIADEVLDSCDSLGIESIIQSLEDIGKTVMVTSQVEINSLKENTLIFQKKNKMTELITQ